MKQTVINELRHIALAHPDREVCGAIIDGKICEFENVHEKSAQNFALNARESAIAMQDDCVIWHTHTAEGFSELTPPDICTADFLKRPILMVNGRGHWDYYDPNTILPFEGRTFKTYHRNCYSLMRDWYRISRGVMLPQFFMHQPRSYCDGTGSEFLKHLEAHGFREVPAKDLIFEGDIVLTTEAPNAVAWHCSIVTNIKPQIYCLSQFIARRSCRFPFRVIRDRIHSIWRYYGAHPN